MGNLTRTNEANAARSKLHRAVVAGKIVKPGACSSCGKAGPLEGAHGDYAKPLDVTWLCTSCHRAWDGRQPKGGTKATAELRERMLGVKDRIVELRRVPASSLRVNPENWRTHPKSQADALRGSLMEVGIVDAVLAFPADGLGPDGDFSDLMLFDGHLRVETMPGQEIPVLVTDLTLAEARKAMATIDPLAAMAESDPVKLDALLKEIETGNEELAVMLAQLSEKNGVPDAGALVVADEVSITVRMTRAEREQCERAAKRAQKKLSAWIRESTLKAGKKETANGKRRPVTTKGR